MRILGKLIPGVGAVVGGGLDLIETRILADCSYQWFFKGDFSVEDEEKEEIEYDK